MSIALVIIALVLYLARKPIAKAVSRKAKKTRKAAAKKAKGLLVALVKLAWTGTKALGREVRAQTSWLREGIARSVQPGDPVTS